MYETELQKYFIYKFKLAHNMLRMFSSLIEFQIRIFGYTYVCTTRTRESFFFLYDMFVLCKLINQPVSLVKELFTYKCTYKSTAISVVVPGV